MREGAEGGGLTPETVVAADNTTEQTDETETALPKTLKKAIESGFVDTITRELEELGIAYEQIDNGIEKDKTGYVETSLYIVKFNYEGKDYKIPCEYNYTFDKTPIDNSVETRLKQAIALFESGNTSETTLLEDLGIEYDMQEHSNGGYTITFSYEGVDYEATYTPREIKYADISNNWRFFSS